MKQSPLKVRRSKLEVIWHQNGTQKSLLVRSQELSDKQNNETRQVYIAINVSTTQMQKVKGQGQGDARPELDL